MSRKKIKEKVPEQSLFQETAKDKVPVKDNAAEKTPEQEPSPETIVPENKKGPVANEIPGSEKSFDKKKTIVEKKNDSQPATPEIKELIREAARDGIIGGFSSYKEWIGMNMGTAKQITKRLRSHKPTEAQEKKIALAVAQGRLPSDTTAKNYIEAFRTLKKVDFERLSPTQIQLIQKGMQDGKIRYIPDDILEKMGRVKGNRILRKLERLYSDEMKDLNMRIAKIERKELKAAKKGEDIGVLVARREKVEKMLDGLSSCCSKTLAPVLSSVDNAIGH